MSAAISLGLRLAMAGPRLRTGLLVGGNALGVALLLVVVVVPRMLIERGRPLSEDELILTGSVGLFLGLPVLVLLSTVARLSATSRDRRLAGLRLLGLAPGRTRLVAAVEAGGVAVAGVPLGIGLFFALRPALEAALGARHDVGAYLSEQIAAPTVVAAVAVCVLVPAVSVVVSLAPSRALRGSAPGIRRGAALTGASWWRAAPAVIGTALLVAALAQRVESDRVVGRTIVVPWLLGSALLGLGLPLAAPILVRGIAAVAAQRARTPAQLLAGRRSELEPATTTRVVAGLIVALFVTTAGQCVLAAFEDTPQYRRALRADTTGPQKAEVVLGPGAALAASDVSALQELPGVRALVPMRTLTTACGREMPPTQAPGEVPPTPATWCVGAFVGTCAELAALADRRSVGCRDDRTAWISTGGWHPVGDGPQPLQRPSRLVLERNDGEPGAALSVPVPTTTVTIPATRDDPNWTAVPGSSLFVPLDTPGAAAAAGPPRQWLAVLDGGSAARSSFAAAARAVPGVEWVEPEGLSDLRTVQGYRSVLFAAGGAALLVGLLALAIALIDRTVERRRQVGALRALGAPGAVVRGAHVMAAAWPVVAALPLAGAAGLFAGRTYLHVIDVDGATPWRTGVTTTLAAVVTGVVVAAATVPAAGTALRPDVLRRE